MRFIWGGRTASAQWITACALATFAGACGDVHTASPGDAGRSGSAGSSGNPGSGGTASGGTSGTAGVGMGGGAGTSTAGTGGGAGTSTAGTGGGAGTATAGTGGGAGTATAGTGGGAGTATAGTGGGAGGGGASGATGTGGAAGTAGKGGASGTAGTGTGGAAGTGGAGGAGGAGGTIACPANQVSCGGTCYNVATDRAHCGASCAACGVTQICNNGCFAAAPLSVLTKWDDPTGRTDGSGSPLKMTFDTTGLPAGTLFKCRTGKLTGPGLAYTTTPAFASCDGGAGTGASYTFAPTADGSYRTDVTYQADSYTSPTFSYEFYVHRSLSGVPTCAANDDFYFQAAKTFNAASAANAALFPLTGAFPAPNNPQTRADPIFTRNPWFKVPFVNVARSSGMSANPGTVWNTTNPTVYELSLRHKLVLSSNTAIAPARSMILLRREYQSPTTVVANKCKNLIPFGSDMGPFVGPATLTRGTRRLDCQALVMSAANGAGLCFDGTGTAQVIDSRIPPPTASSPGSVTVTAGSTAVTGAATGFSASQVNGFIQFASDPSWYQIAGVGSTIQLTLKTPAQVTSVGAAYKLAPAGAGQATLVTPTGYAKIASQNEGAAKIAATTGGVEGNKCSATDPSVCPDTTVYPNVYYLPP